MSTIDSIIFLGTGTSSGIPSVSCLLVPDSCCNVCLDTLKTPGSKNIRRNTALVVRVRVPGKERLRTILIDCGKTFYEQAKIHFVQHKLCEIDALILTHGHADAMYGLDDLRSWTLNGIIQNTIPIYLTNDTFDAVQMAFPYMVDTSRATGGGDVPSFDFHFIDSLNPFKIEGLEFIPLPVQHGLYMATKEPYMSLGFRFGQVTYIADVSFIPPTTSELIRGSEVFICDALRKERHSSHFSLDEAIKEATHVRARKTYLTGFSHKLDHDTTVTELEPLEKTHRIWIRPAYDGLKVTFSEGNIIEE